MISKLLLWKSKFIIYRGHDDKKNTMYWHWVRLENNQWVCHCIRPGFDSRMNMEFSEVYDHLLPTVEPLKRLIPVVHRTGLNLVSRVANACNKSRLATAVTEDPYTLYANKQTRVAWAMMLSGIIHLSADICNVNIKTYTIVYQVLFYFSLVWDYKCLLSECVIYHL